MSKARSHATREEHVTGPPIADPVSDTAGPPEETVRPPTSDPVAVLVEAAATSARYLAGAIEALESGLAGGGLAVKDRLKQLRELTRSWADAHAVPADATRLVPHLVHLLDDDETWTVRQRAAQCLGNLEAVEALGPLERLAESESEEKRKQFLRQVARHIRLSQGSVADARTPAPPREAVPARLTGTRNDLTVRGLSSSAIPSPRPSSPSSSEGPEDAAASNLSDASPDAVSRIVDCVESDPRILKQMVNQFNRWLKARAKQKFETYSLKRREVHRINVLTRLYLCQLLFGSKPCTLHAPPPKRGQGNFHVRVGKETVYARVSFPRRLSVRPKDTATSSAEQ
jgi:hypothetical protein